MTGLSRRCFRGLLVFLVAGPVFCQERAETPFALRADVNLVLVPVTLMDRRGALVTDLERQHFTVLQDGTPQPIVSFSRENLPCTLAIVLDASGSMAHDLSLAKELTSTVLAASEPKDEAFLVSVSDRPEIQAAMTTETDPVRSLLPLINSGGDTALIDSIYLALGQLRKAHNPRKALLIVSDGMDNNSRHTKSELMRMAVEADVQIYTVSIGAPIRNKKPIEVREERLGLEFMTNLAERTGGIHYTIEFPNEITHVSQELGRALRDQYVIGYCPSREEEARKWHKIKVTLDVPKVAVYARSGYYSR